MAISAGITTSAQTSGEGGARIVDTDERNTTTETIDGECIILAGTNAFLGTGATAGSLTITNSIILISTDVPASFAAGHTNDGADAAITYGNQDATGTVMKFVNSQVIMESPVGIFPFRVTHLENFKFYSEDGNNPDSVVYTAPNCTMQNVVLDGIYLWELLGQPTIFDNVVIQNGNFGYANFEGGTNHMFGFDATNILNGSTWHEAADSVSWQWNTGPNFDPERMHMRQPGCEWYDGKTAAWKFKDQLSLAAVNDVTLIFRDDFVTPTTQVIRGTYTTGTDGILEGTYDSQSRATVASADRPILFVVQQFVDDTSNTNNSGDFPVVAIVGNVSRVENYTITAVQPQVEVRSYGHLSPVGFEVGDDFNPTGPIGVRAPNGTVETFQDFLLIPDAGISQATVATVEAYTELETLDKAYDRIKAEWRNTNDYPLPVFVGSAMDLGAVDLIIDGDMTTAYSFAAGDITIGTDTGSSSNLAPGTKVKEITTTGIVTLRDGASLDGVTVNGDVTLLTDTDLSNLTITGDLRINIAVNTTMDFTNVNVTGSVFNDATGNTLTINNSGGSMTAGDAGTGNGQTNIVSSVPITITVVDTSGNPIANANVVLGTAAGLTDVVDNLLTNGSGVVSTTYPGTTPDAVEGFAAKGSELPTFIRAPISGTVASGTGFVQTVTMVSDD